MKGTFGLKPQDTEQHITNHICRTKKVSGKPPGMNEGTVVSLRSIAAPYRLGFRFAPTYGL